MTGQLGEAYHEEDFRLQKSAVPPRGEAWDMRWSWTKAAQSNGNHNVGSGGRGIQQMAQGRKDRADPDHVENDWKWDGPQGPGDPTVNDGAAWFPNDNILFPYLTGGTQLNSQVILNKPVNDVDDNACGKELTGVYDYSSLNKDLDTCPDAKITHFGVAPSARGCHM